MADLKQTSNGADYTTYQLNPYLKKSFKISRSVSFSFSNW